MAQQINLYSPILLAPRRHFSAGAMVQALAALLAGLAAFTWWADGTTARLQRETAATAAAQQAEKQRLTAELAQRPAVAADTTALTQELAQAQKALAERRQLLDEFAPQGGRASLLRLLAQTVPDSAWLTEVQLAGGRLELAGMALQPETLRPWLDRLAAQPLLPGLALQTLKVERSDAAGTEAWAFRVVGSRGGAAQGGRP